MKCVNDSVKAMSDKELIENILVESSIVANNSSIYIDKYMNDLYALLKEKDERKLIHTLEKKNDTDATGN